jgi:predicted outer membrane repeat protein
VSALASAIDGAPDGAVLRLASCTHVLTGNLPIIHTRRTLQGAADSTIERRYGASTPRFSLLSVAPGGNLTVTHVNFTNGYAPTVGGAIDGEDAPVSITGGTFTGNHAGEYGGAIWNEEGLTVTGATFADNSAANYGGAIDNEDDATISGSTFSGNTSEYGGALENDDDVTLSNSTFTSNSVSEYGGAIEDEGDGIVVNNSYFQQNTATSEGGAIADYEDMTLTGLPSNTILAPITAVPSTPRTTPRSTALPSRATGPPMVAAFTTTTS